MNLNLNILQEVEIESNTSFSFDDKRSDRLTSLTDIFPLIPPDLFEPLFNLTDEDFSNIVIDLTCKEDNLDIMEYLGKMVDEYENRSMGSSSPLDCVDSSSLEEDRVLTSLENQESDKCLILGRMFLQQAHSKYKSLCGTEDIDISSIPPEISEMNWRPSDEIMLTIYRAFMTDLGIIGNEEEEVAVRKVYAEEPMQMREILEYEAVVAESIKSHRAKIKEYPNLELQVEFLTKRYPGMSIDAVEEAFISCDMDSVRTINELSSKGLTSSVGTHMASIDVSPIKRSAKTQRVKARLEVENSRITHIKSKLSQAKTNALLGQVQGYWQEELRQSVLRMKWLREQDGLATVAQRKKLYGSGQLDLHGLTCADALTALKGRIEELSGYKGSPGHETHLNIICGRGLHSQHGRSRLKPVVRKYLSERALLFSQPFDGTFRLSLRQLHHDH